MVIDFYDQHGKRRLKTLAKGTTKKQARKILHSIIKDIENGTYLPEGKVPTFADVADGLRRHFCSHE